MTAGPGLAGKPMRFAVGADDRQRTVVYKSLEQMGEWEDGNPFPISRRLEANRRSEHRETKAASPHLCLMCKAAKLYLIGVETDKAFSGRLSVFLLIPVVIDVRGY